MPYILCSCTAQKRENPLQELNIKNIIAATQEEQIQTWNDNLTTYREKQKNAGRQKGILARDMYLGSIWTPIRKMLSHVSVDGGLVMSAGLGLVDFDESIPSYASTFVAGDQDSILGAGDIQKCRDWWYALQSRSYFQNWLNHRRNPKIISILPQSYLHIAEELLEGFVEKYGEENLLLLSPQVQSSKLQKCWIRIDSKMTHIVGGKMGDVSVRVLSWILLKQYPNKSVSLAQITQECQQILEQTKNMEPIIKVGEKQSDEAILEWLMQLYKENPNISRTTAHKKLRKAGLACSTSRFKKLFEASTQPRQMSLFPLQK